MVYHWILTTKTSPPNVEDGGVVGTVGPNFVGKITGEDVTIGLEDFEDTTDVSPTSKIGGDDVTALKDIIKLDNSIMSEVLYT